MYSILNYSIFFLLIILITCFFSFKILKFFKLFFLFLLQPSLHQIHEQRFQGRHQSSSAATLPCFVHGRAAEPFELVLHCTRFFASEGCVANGEPNKGTKQHKTFGPKRNPMN